MRLKKPFVRLVLLFCKLFLCFSMAQAYALDPFDWQDDPALTQNGKGNKALLHKEPTHCIYQARHQDAAYLLHLLKHHKPLGVAGKSAWVYGKRNVLMVQTEHPCDALNDWLASQDVPTSQIRIHAYLLTLNREKNFDFGLDFGLHPSDSSGSQDLYRALPFPSQTSAPKAWRLMSFADGTTLDARLEAMEAEGSVMILSAPQIMTQSGKKALIESGDELPYADETQDGGTHIQFKKAVLSLEITPFLHYNQSVDLKIHVTQDKISHVTVHGQAGIDTKTLDTTVSVHPHEVLVLGGLFEQGDQRSKACLPWLGKLPGVGPLFCHHHSQTRKQALWVLIQVDVLPVSVLVKMDHKLDKAS